MTSRNASVQWRMLGAAVLKGTGVVMFEGRLSLLQHSLVPQIQSGLSFTAQHESCQPRLTWLYVCALLALKMDSEAMGFFQPKWWGEGGCVSEMLGKEEEGRMWRRVEQKPCWTSVGVGAGESVREGRNRVRKWSLMANKRH